MKPFRTIYLLLVVLVVLPFAAIAQNKSPELDTSRFGDPSGIARGLQGDIYGVIKSINDKELVLDKTKFGVDTTIKLESATKYVRDGKAGKFDQLKVGDQVYAHVKTNKKTREMTAKKITSGVIPLPQ